VIHEVMRQRFEQAAIMQSSQGEKYGLPTVGLVDNFQFDFRTWITSNAFYGNTGCCFSITTIWAEFSV